MNPLTAYDNFIVFDTDVMLNHLHENYKFVVLAQMVIGFMYNSMKHAKSSAL